MWVYIFLCNWQALWISSDTLFCGYRHVSNDFILTIDFGLSRDEPIMLFFLPIILSSNSF